MNTIGIICEYNPFHTGHAWQLGTLRSRFGEDCAIVCAMSGNFVQRGDFALLRKHVRAEAAVRGGADLVLELPLPWATASAEGFARGGVAVLEGTGVVDTLAFGSECGDTARIRRAAEGLQSAEYPALLRQELDKGNSFAAARQQALAGLIGAADAKVLALPNNNLGVEYCRALGELGSGVTPLALPRAGAAHDGGEEGGFASASAIRAALRAGSDACEPYLTPDMLRLYRSERAAGRAPVRMEALERAILLRLRTMREEDFAAYDEGGEGLYHRFYEASRSAVGIEELLDAVKTKRYAHARLRRMLLGILLGLRPDERPERPPYLRVLAMNERGTALLHEMRGRAALPVVIRPTDARELSEAARRLMELEARADDVYALAYPDLAESAAGSEWRTSPVVMGKEKRR